MVQYTLTEEIARWAFEVRCKESNKWHIAFTNPTAGPWKTITASDENGVLGEIYRFQSKEVRPDVVIYNDEFKVILIIEAKDSLSKLVQGNQAEKSVEVIVNLSRVLKQLNTSPFWRSRIDYNIYTGILWGTTNEHSNKEIYSIMDEYQEETARHPELNSDLIVGIESFKNPDGSIDCTLYHRQYNEKGLEPKTLTAIAHSLGVILYEP